MSHSLKTSWALARRAAVRRTTARVNNPRWFTATSRSLADGALPLAGYRVLDMTRVLAGVNDVNAPFTTRFVGTDSLAIALLHADSGGPWVSSSGSESYYSGPGGSSAKIHREQK